jgi:hypothetical protein
MQIFRSKGLGLDQAPIREVKGQSEKKLKKENTNKK